MSLAPVTAAIGRLRRRERQLAAAWGAARWLALVLTVLTVACLIDWWVDRRRDMPGWLRAGLLATQAGIAGVAAWAWLIRPIVRRRPDAEVALFVESRRPELGHCLISAVQLNQPTADVAHMSSELIARVTAEASAAAGRIDFPELADHRRLRWAWRLAAAVMLAAAVAVAAAPATVAALVRRQFLADVAVPRRVTLADRTPAVQPAAEPVTLRFAVAGPGPYSGDVRLVPDDGPAERIAVTTEPVNGLLTLTLPAPASDFAFEAWLGDGRLAAPGRVTLVPRPAVDEIAARLILPAFVGRRPDGSPFDTPLPRGDVAGIVGCSARVVARASKPVARAVLEMLSAGDALSAEPPRVTRALPMELDARRTSAAATFDLRAGEVGYRIVVVDEHEFRNLDAPRRDVRLVAEDSPTVALLPEQFRPDGLGGAGEEFEVEGVPVPLGGAVRIGYTATHPYGLGRAYLVYRVVAGTPLAPTDGSAADQLPRPDGERWRRLPLAEGPPTGARNEQVQFHAAESTDASRPGRTEGGGRFDFQTRGLDGVKIGDTIEYFVEVTNRNPNQPLAGRSETRAKKVVTVAELMSWIDATLRQEDRIRRLTERQRGVFDR